MIILLRVLIPCGWLDVAKQNMRIYYCLEGLASLFDPFEEPRNRFSCSLITLN